MGRILGIAGSLRRGSYNAALLRAAGELLPGGFELEIYDGLRDLPPYDADEDLEPAHPAVAALREAIERSDGLLVATPEYNGSLPGVLKNALDWASRPYPESALRGKPAAVVGASTGLFGAVWAQAETRKVLEVTGAQVIDAELPVAMADAAFTEEGQLADPEQRLALAELLAALAELVGAPAPSA